MQKKKGISLIVLVITIIVMIILAGAVIISLNNSGIIERANSAKRKYNDKEYETQIKVAIMQYELDKRNDSSMTLENSMKSTLENTFGDTVTVEKENKTITITFDNSNLSYRVLPNGKVRRLMDVTDIYGKFVEEEKTLYLRATPKNSYEKLINYYGIQNTEKTLVKKDIEEIIIEEEIAPITLSFSNCNNLVSIKNMENLHTENMISMSGMFSACNLLIELDLSYFDTSKVTSFGQFMRNCYSIETVDLSSFDTSRVTDMGYMLSDNNLTKLDLSSFDTSNVIYLNNMFSYTPKLASLDISNFEIGDNTNFNNFIDIWSPYGIKKKIRATQTTADKLMEKFDFLTEENFEIVN